MKAVHTFSIAILLAIAAGLGVAAAHPAGAGQARVAASPPATAAAANPSVRLDRWQKQLQRALRRRPPKLPRLVHFPRVSAPVLTASPVISQVSVQAPRTIYVHAKAAPAAPRGHEHESNREHSDGGGHDD
jgi:hypothetical protein